MTEHVVVVARRHTGEAVRNGTAVSVAACRLESEDIAGYAAAGSSRVIPGVPDGR